MALEIQGRLQRILPPEEGVSQTTGKPWKKQIFVIQYQDGKFPRNVAFLTWNETTEILQNLRVGDNIKVYFRPESREFNGRWYTDLTVWKIVKIREEELSPKRPFSATDEAESIIYKNTAEETFDTNMELTSESNSEADDELEQLFGETSDDAHIAGDENLNNNLDEGLMSEDDELPF